MGKQFLEYKAKIIEHAIRIASQKINLPENIGETVRGKVEFVGVPERDIDMILKAIEDSLAPPASYL